MKGLVVLDTKDYKTIQIIKKAGAFAIKNSLKKEQFTVPVFDFIMENLGFEQLLECFSDENMYIEYFPSDKFHEYLKYVIKNKKIYVKKPQTIKIIIEYIKIDFTLTESEKKKYLHDLHWGSNDIN